MSSNNYDNAYYRTCISTYKIIILYRSTCVLVSVIYYNSTGYRSDTFLRNTVCHCFFFFFFEKRSPLGYFYIIIGWHCLLLFFFLPLYFIRICFSRYSVRCIIIIRRLFTVNVFLKTITKNAVPTLNSCRC